MEEFKFQKIQEIVLFNIARARKLVNADEIVSLTGNSLNKKQILNATDNLRRRNLIRQSKKGSPILFYLNLNQIFRIKKLLGNHFEDNWENEWGSLLNAVKN